MPLDLATAAHWRWLPAGSPLSNWADLVVDLRPAAVREQVPVPSEWTPQVGYPSETTLWRMDAMTVPHPREELDDGCSGSLRFSGADGFRFVVAVAKGSNGRSLPVGAFASVLPSLRQVLVPAGGGVETGPDPVRETDQPRDAWEYRIGALAAAVRDPHQWFGLPTPAPERTRGGFRVSLRQATMLLRWALVDVGADDAYVWSDAGFTPPDVGKWTHPRKKDAWTAFAPEEAREWAHGFGVKNPKVANSWRRGGFSIAEATHWAKVLGHAAFTPLAQPQHWAKVTDPDRRHAYMGARFTGEEVAEYEAGDEPPTVEQLNLLAALGGYVVEPRPR